MFDLAIKNPVIFPTWEVFELRRVLVASVKDAILMNIYYEDNQIVAVVHWAGSTVRRAARFEMSEEGYHQAFSYCEETRLALLTEVFARFDTFTLPTWAGFQKAGTAHDYIRVVSVRLRAQLDTKRLHVRIFVNERRVETVDFDLTEKGYSAALAYCTDWQKSFFLGLL